MNHEQWSRQAFTPRIGRLFRFAPRPDVAADLAEFARRDIFELAALLVEPLVDFYGRFLHYGMAFRGAAEEDEVFAAGESLLPILRIEGQSQQSGFADTVVRFQENISGRKNTVQRGGLNFDYRGRLC